MAEDPTLQVDFKSLETKTSSSDKPYSNDLATGRNQDFINSKFLEAYKIKKHLTSAPTYYPKNFFEQFAFYDDGTNRYLYIFVNGVWRKTSLT